MAEEHLYRELRRSRGVTDCQRIEAEGGADIRLRFQGSLLTVECKNVLRKKTKEGIPRVDFQRTRASLSDPSSRYYGPDDFDIVAACLHAVSERWEFRYALTASLDPHKRFPG